MRLSSKLHNQAICEVGLSWGDREVEGDLNKCQSSRLLWQAGVIATSCFFFFVVESSRHRDQLTLLRVFML